MRGKDYKREEVVGTREVYKSCFFVGCAAAIILIVASIAYLIWLFTKDPVISYN